MKFSPAMRLVVGATILLTVSVATGCTSYTPARYAAADLPNGVKLQQVDGGANYFAGKSSKSAWMDHHILLGAWLEQPLNTTEVAYDHATGDNIYWNLAGIGRPCSGMPCVASYGVIRNGGMHISAPSATTDSGLESVAYEGADEADMEYGPGWDGWDKTNSKCVPANGKCGYTVAQWYYTGQPASLGTLNYPVSGTVKQQGYGKGVLFWETADQAAEFLKFTDILSADSYWMTDSSLDLPSQAGCALFPEDKEICGKGSGAGLSSAQRQLPANYAYNVTKLEQLEAMNGTSKPVVVDVETGCPFTDNDSCTTPDAMVAAAWHALIAGARGILWFQHNFGGPCVDFRTIIDGSNKASSNYNCQQTPGVTMHDVVAALTGFNSQVNSLSTVLLSPFAEGYVSSTDDVSYMAKYVNGNFYIFAASGTPGMPPPLNQRVQFSIAGAPNCRIKVVNENRSISVSNGKFNDVFQNADSVHIYQVSC